MDSRAALLMKRLEKKARRGFQGEPTGTVAFYGPDNRTASKVVVGILREGSEAELKKWFLDDGDLRNDDATMKAVVDHLDEQRVATVSMTPGIFGCPHEEEVDYPLGGKCPQCKYWATHDRTEILPDRGKPSMSRSEALARHGMQKAREQASDGDA